MKTLTEDEKRTRSLLLLETGLRLHGIERCSSLSTEQFCRSVLRLAGNDAVLRSVLETSRLSIERPDPAAPSKDNVAIPLAAPTGVPVAVAEPAKSTDS